jgi:hypothetical protein
MPLSLTSDVSEAIGSGERRTQTAWGFLPDRPAEAPAILVCLASGLHKNTTGAWRFPDMPTTASADTWPPPVMSLLPWTIWASEKAPIRSTPVPSAWSWRRFRRVAEPQQAGQLHRVIRRHSVPGAESRKLPQLRQPPRWAVGPHRGAGADPGPMNLP